MSDEDTQDFLTRTLEESVLTYPFGYAERTQAQGQLSIGVCFEHGQLSVSGTFDELRIILHQMTEQLEEAHRRDAGAQG